ncbi:MAG: ATP-binding protein [Pseudomonadales bacterium]|nr:ATP-binding protein [Pseudomonadales bacterium]
MYLKKFVTDYLLLQMLRKAPLSAACLGLILVCAHCLLISTAIASEASPLNVLIKKITKPHTQYILWDEPPDLEAHIRSTAPDKLAWSPPQLKPINLGFSRQTIWIKIPVYLPENQQTAQNFVLYIDYPLINELEFYVGVNKKIRTHIVTGDAHPFDTRVIKQRGFALPFTLNPGETGYIFLAASATDTIQFPIQIFTRDKFEDHSTREHYLFGIYYGGLFIMIFFMCFLYFILRDRTLLLFTAFTACVIFLTSSLNGDLLLLFPNIDPIFNKWIRVYMLLAGSVSMCAFAKDFLNTAERHPKLNKMVKYAINASFLVCFTIHLLPFYYAIQFALFWVVLLGSFALALGFVSIFNNYTPAKFFLTGWFIFLAGGFSNVFRAFSVFPTNFVTEYGVQLGALFNVVTIALGIAHRFTTERKRLFAAEKSAQEERHKKEQAQAEVRAKSQFLANMSHEIRTPMNGVLGITNLLKDTPLNPQQQQYVNTIENSGKSLLAVINDILDYSKIEAGKMTIEKIEFNIDELVSEAASLFSSVADDKNLDFHVICKTNIPAFIFSDPVRLRQILLNLLSNAFKFTQEGFVNIEYAVIEEKKHTLIKFTIYDSGIGLTQEQQSSLFQSFVQADTSTTRQFGGTGLGLSISQRLCHLLGGDIGVDSKPGKGSSFWFTLRANLEEMPPKKVINFKRHHLDLFRDQCILIADPHPKTLTSLKLRFDQWQCRCKTFTSNELLLEGYKEDQKPLAIILDYDQLHASPTQLENVLEQLHDEKTPILFSASVMIKPTIDNQQFHQPIRIIEKPVNFYRVYHQIEECISEQQISADGGASKFDFSELRCIVAEDNKVNQMVIKGMLKRLGIHADIVANGQECVDLFATTTQTDCVIMDCEMPIMDGYSAAASIRKMPQLHQPVIIGLSANALKEHEDKALAHGMDIYLRKPVNYEQLRGTLIDYFHDK